jgi:hypothetical protein
MVAQHALLLKVCPVFYGLFVRSDVDFEHIEMLNKHIAPFGRAARVAA